MALVLADRVEQVTRTTGLGDLTLAETIRGRQSFQEVTNNGDTVIYVLEDAEGTEWEIGTGTVIHGTETVLQRTTIRQSSNSDAKISLSAGTHRVFLAADAQFFGSIVTSGAITAAIAAHEAEADPHPQYTTTAEAAAAAPVQTVNGATGTVLLDAVDVGATPASHVGTGGVQHADATTTVSGFMSGADKTKLNGVEANAKDDQSAAEVPYSNTTSGLTATDVQAAIDEVDSDLDAHIAAGDPHPQYTLEADLASSDAGKGSDRMAHTGTTDTVTEALDNRVIRVSSRTEMKAYDVPAGHQFSLEEGGRSGIFVVKSGTPPSDTREAIYVVLNNGNYAMRRYDGITGFSGVNVLWFGCNADGEGSDVAAFEAALTYVEGLQGTLLIPAGEYAAKLRISQGNIKIKGEPGTLLRAFDNDQMFHVLDTAENVFAENISLNGQLKSQLGTRDVRASYGFDLRGRNIKLQNVEAEAFRIDCLYVRALQNANIRINGFYFGDTSRNTCSIVEGSHVYLSNGTVYNKGDYDSTYAAGGLYLYDIEANPASPKVTHVYHENVNFLSDNPKAQTTEVQVITLESDASLEDMDVYFKNCFFGIGEIGSRAVSLRLKNANGTIVRRVFVDDSYFAGRVITNASTDAPVRTQECRFKNIRLGNSAFSFACNIGENTELDNIKTSDTSLTIAGVNNVGVWRRDVQDYSDTVFTDQYIPVDANRKVYTQAFTINDTTNYTSVVQLGTRTSYKVTVSSDDPSSGQGGGIVETACVVTGDFSTNGAITDIINPTLTGVDAQWENTNGIAASSRTLQIKPRSATYNLWSVTVEALGRYSDTDGAPTWL